MWVAEQGPLCLWLRTINQEASFITSLLFMTALLYLDDPHFSICNSLCLFSCTSLVPFIFTYKIK